MRIPVPPPALRPGDTVAVISLSAGLAALLPHRYAIGKQQLAETFGLTVIDTPHATRDPSWLRDNPQARAADLHWALENPEVRGIVSAVGGDDSIRILPHLDLDLIAANPKVFTGYSDTTMTHLAFAKAGVGSFYGMAVLTTAAENGGIHPYSSEAFSKTVMSSDPVGALAPPEWTEEFLDWANLALQQRPRRWVPNAGWQWRQGESAVQGHLMGGCLETLAMAIGTDVWPAVETFEGAVLHLEISEERPPIAQVRYWLRNFAAAGIVERLAGLLFSRPQEYTLRDTFALYDAIEAELALAGRPDLPFVANLDFGHTAPMGLLPLGRQVRIDPDARTISIPEPAVTPR